MLYKWYNWNTKGAVLSHGNLIVNIAGEVLKSSFIHLIYLFYLPLAHIYERANQIILVYYGGSVGFYQGYEEIGQLCSDPRARMAVLADMNEVGKEAQLRSFECVKAMTLVVEPFTMDNGLLTLTFKIKRP